MKTLEQLAAWVAFAACLTLVWGVMAMAWM
jgi:hypothetical protein